MLKKYSIPQSTSSDSHELNTITKLSKASWGYSKEQICAWSDDLTITSKYIRENEIYKLLINNEIVGYYSYFKIQPLSILLDNIFILPKYIHKGYGKILMLDLFTRVANDGICIIRLYSEPKAQLFYQKLGFTPKGQYHTKISNR